MNGNDLERELHDELRQRAGQVTGGFTLADVQARAGTMRRHNRRRWATALAAAAVVAVAVPAGLVLRPHDAAQPADPGPTPTAVPDKLPAPTPTPTASASDSGLAALPQGKAPAWSWLYDGTIHLGSGGTAALPGKLATVTAFSGFKGGWLVADEDASRLEQYAGSGALVRGGSGSRIVVGTDGTRTAFTLDDQIHLAGSSSMGDGEQTFPMSGWSLFAMGHEGPLVTDDSGTVRELRTGAAPIDLRGLAGPTAASDTAGLVGGVLDGAHGAVLSLSDGATVWKGAWRPLAFSDDGTRMAGTPIGDNGEASSVAIIDLASGDVLARAALADRLIYPSLRVVFEDESHVLFVADGGATTSAILRLGLDGTLERATDVMDPGPSGPRPLLSIGR